MSKYDLVKGLIESCKIGYDTYQDMITIAIDKELFKECKLQINEVLSKAEKYDEIKDDIFVKDLDELTKENQVLKDGIKALRMLTGFEVKCKENPAKMSDLGIRVSLCKGVDKMTSIEAINKGATFTQYYISIYYANDKCAMQKEMSKDVYEQINKMIEVVDNE